MKQRGKQNPVPTERPKAPPMFKSRATKTNEHTGHLPNQGRNVGADKPGTDSPNTRHLHHYGKKT